jgi:ArsR family transcriptional regulator
MQRDVAKEELSKLLVTYFCDAKKVEEHKSLLKNFTGKYFERFDFRKRARIFNALADENRLKILNLLTFREMCVCELTAALDMTQPNLTYHIKKIENVGLVKHNKRGKWVYYSLADEKGLLQFERACAFNLSALGDTYI